MGKTESFKKLNLEEPSFGFCVELPIKSKRNGMKFYSIAAHEKKRIAGKKNFYLIFNGNWRSIMS